MTTSYFIEGIILGFGAAVPLGPINILIMNEALREYKNALAIGLGAMSADITHLLLIVFGVTYYLKDTLLLEIVSFLGGLFLIYLSFLIFKGRNRTISKLKQSKKQRSVISNYIKGYTLTLLNPYTILFWLSVTTYVTSSEALGLKLCGMVFAIMVWITLMPYFIYTKRSLISHTLSYKIAIASSIIILFFGISLLIKSSSITSLYS